MKKQLYSILAALLISGIAQANSKKFLKEIKPLTSIEDIKTKPFDESILSAHALKLEAEKAPTNRNFLKEDILTHFKEILLVGYSSKKALDLKALETLIEANTLMRTLGKTKKVGGTTFDKIGIKIDRLLKTAKAFVEEKIPKREEQQKKKAQQEAQRLSLLRREVREIHRRKQLKKAREMGYVLSR